LIIVRDFVGFDFIHTLETMYVVGVRIKPADFLIESIKRKPPHPKPMRGFLVGGLI